MSNLRKVGGGGRGVLGRTFTAYRVHYNNIYCYCTSSGYFSMPRESRRKVIARFMNSFQTCLIIISLVQTNVKGNVYLLLLGRLDRKSVV